MSIIFPSKPAPVAIQNLPTKAEFISYRIQEGYLKIKAWMKDGMGFIETSEDELDTYNDFHERYCDGCERITHDYFCDNYGNGDGYIDYNRAINSGECMVRFDGYEGQDCPEGHELSSTIPNRIELKNLVFEGSFFLTEKQVRSGRDEYGEKIWETVERFKPFSFNVHLCKGDFDEDNNIIHTSKRPCSNVHCDYEAPSVGKVCWGEYDTPRNIREAVSVFTTTKFNNDLINVRTFIEGISDVENQTPFIKSKDNNFLCAGYDALMMLDGERDRQAFYTMLTAGFRSLPDAPHIMLIPLEQATIRKNDEFYFGYLTKPDSVGRQWYISSENYLIGQMDDSFIRTQ
jgi:hypothetical protein